MPALKFIFDGDATPFSRALNVLEKSAARSGSVTIAQMKGASAELQRAAAAAREAGKSTVFYDYAIEGLNQKIQKYTALQEAAAKRTNELALAKTKAAMAGGGESVDLSGRSLSDRYGADARIQRRLDARRTAAAAEIAAAEDAMAIARAKAARINVDSPEMRRRALISTYQRESTPGFIGPKSLSAQQVYEAEQTLTTRRNRAAEIRRDRAAERAAAAERLTEEQRLASVEAATRNNKLRELLRQRAAERQANAERLAEEARVASVELASRSNQARRLVRQRQAERADAAADARAQVFQTATFGVSGMGTKFSGINAGWTQMAHVIRASADSIASGMNPMRVAMQQIPQAMQAMMLMGGKLPGLKYFIKDTSLASEKLALSMSTAATQSAGVAAASHLAADAEEALTGATSASTIAARAKAAADTDVALKAQARAKAAQEVAAVERAQVGPSKMQFGGLGLAAAIVAGLAVGAAIAYKHVSSLVDKLNGVKIGDQRLDYIVKRLRRAGQEAEAQRVINVELQRAIDLENSAATAAERRAKATQETFDHLKAMNDIEAEIAADAATTPEEKFAAEQKFGQRRLELEKQQRAQEQADRQQAVADLAAEQKNLTQAANEKVRDLPGAAGEEQNLRLQEEQLKAAEDAAAEIEKAKKDPGYFGLANNRDIFRAYNKAVPIAGDILTVGGRSILKKIAGGQDVSNADLDRAEQEVLKDRNTRRERLKQLREQKDANDIIRAEAEAMRQRAAQAGVKKIETQAEIKQAEKNNPTIDARQQEEFGMKMVKAAIVARKGGLSQAETAFQDSLKPLTKPQKIAVINAEIKKEQDRLAIQEGNAAGNEPEAKRLRKRILELQNQAGAIEKEEPARGRGGGYTPELTANQRIGAYISGPQISLLDVNRQMDAKLAQIVKNTTPGAGKFSGHIIAGGFRGKQ